MDTDISMKNLQSLADSQPARFRQPNGFGGFARFQQRRKIFSTQGLPRTARHVPRGVRCEAFHGAASKPKTVCAAAKRLTLLTNRAR
jgi:hypothetical protein